MVLGREREPLVDQRILIVEDDRSIRQLLVTVLRKQGITADTAEDGEEGLACLARNHYSLVLLDAMMPRMTGYEFLEHIKDRPAADRPLIFLLTASHSPRHYDPDLVAGTIRKPFDVELLMKIVSACLRAEEPQHVA
jgi:DNA-binding response OmpR family regulator